jgi:phage recombination protein Bet
VSETILPALIDQQALQVKPVVITDEQLVLIRDTIAKDATPEELQLFFYDCRRRGVHPLDKLIHFTKRAGKYTPVVSIDFLRSRAAETGEHAGTDDAVFSTAASGSLESATVTAWRLVQGQRMPFTATARWTEYLPDAPNNFMWLKMPHGQLGKCAEALALRKAFPQQLADLRSFEEMDQSVGDPAPHVDEPRKRPSRLSTHDRPSEPGDRQETSSEGVTRVTGVKPMNGETKGKKWILYVVTFEDGRSGATLDEKIARTATDLMGQGTAVIPTLAPGKKAGQFQLVEFSLPVDR